MTTPIVQCQFCKHSEGRTCKAFPDRIPKEIFYDRADHTVAWPGDHGVQFEPFDERNRILFRRAFPNSRGVKSGRI